MKMTDRELMPFAEYCLGFYGRGGIYDMGASLKEIMAATRKRLADKTAIEFHGDTFDREMVRDILIADFGKVFPT